MPSHALAFGAVLVVKLPRKGLVERRPITQCIGVLRQLKLLVPRHDQIVRYNLIRRVSTLDEVEIEVVVPADFIVLFLAPLMVLCRLLLNDLKSVAADIIGDQFILLVAQSGVRVGCASGGHETQTEKQH
jgi:hypothetical protein